MSTLSVTTINTANGTTDLIMTSGNTAGGKVVVSSSGGVFLQGNSGANAIVIATNNAITFSTDITASGTVAMASSFKRNRIINGNMLIDQRNAGAQISAANLTSGTYMVDRFQYFASQASKFTAQQNAGAVTPPTGFSNYLGMTVASAVSIGASDYFGISEAIEGFNFADLGFGTASAKTVTLSFVVYSSLTGTFGGALKNFALTRSYPFSYTIPTANTWTTISVTIAGDTSGTWVGATNNGAALVQFGLGFGSSNSATAGAWAAGNYSSATGAVSVVGTSGATFYITGVQLEVGTKATPYEMQIYSDQLAQCQRYYYQTTPSFCTLYGFANATGWVGSLVKFPVTMRVTPTMAVVGTFTASNASGVNLAGVSPDGFSLYTQANSTGNLILYPPASGPGITASAEL